MDQPGSDVLLERMMTLHPKIIDLTLDRVWRLLGRLGNPEQNLPPVIHIAGTNGKGSVLAMIRAGLEACGARTHAYTSPHLARFNERIYLAGHLIEESALSDILERCETANGGSEITYFEITTASALLAFAETPADYTLLEVGLGGRLDATNVVKQPALSVITPVSIDHKQYLGDTLREIAHEKAGIIKSGCPCIVGRQEPAALAVIEAQADKVGAPLLRYGHEWHIRETQTGVQFQDKAGELNLPAPTLIGSHQIENAGIALAALRSLKQEAGSNAALTKAHWPARMQRLDKGPLVAKANPAELWLDGGHNPAAGTALSATLAQLPKKRLALICGMLNTKDNTNFLRPLAKQAHIIICVEIPGEPASMPGAALADIAQTLGSSATVAPDIVAALEIARDQHDAKRILICGSLYLAGHVLRIG